MVITGFGAFRWRIALRGYEHVYSMSSGGMNPLHNKSEFAGRPRKLPFRFTTICLHPNFMTEAEFAEFEQFINANRKSFIDPNSITETKRKKSILDTIVSKIYFLKRSLRKH